MMKKFLSVAAAILCIATIPSVSNAQLRGEAYFSLPMPTGDFADAAKPGFGAGAGVYYGIPQMPNLHLGVQGAFNWFDFDDSLPTNGSWRVIELVPTARLFLYDYDDLNNVFNIYLQAGAGAFFWTSDPDTGGSTDGTDFGISVGVGASGRFSDRMSFFIQPKFTWVNTEDGDLDSNITYVPLNFGILF